MNDFDLRSFIDNLRATKPPYECPFEECGRIYKSFSGIQSHLVNFKHNEKSEPKFGASSNRALTRDSLTWLQAQKIVDFELDGKSVRINIYEPLEVSFRFFSRFRPLLDSFSNCLRSFPSTITMWSQKNVRRKN